MTRRSIVVIIITVLLSFATSSVIARQAKGLKQQADSLFARGQGRKLSAVIVRLQCTPVVRNGPKFTETFDWSFHQNAIEVLRTAHTL